jgi:hypothetical protein
MGLFRQEDINPREIAIEWERQLSDEKLKDFRKAVEFYRKGDRALEGKSDDLEADFEKIEDEQKGSENDK